MKNTSMLMLVVTLLSFSRAAHAIPETANANPLNLPRKLDAESRHLKGSSHNTHANEHTQEDVAHAHASDDIDVTGGDAMLQMHHHDSERHRRDEKQFMITFFFSMMAMFVCACCLVRFHMFFDEAERDYFREQDERDRRELERQRRRRTRRRKLTKQQIKDNFPVFAVSENKELRRVSGSLFPTNRAPNTHADATAAEPLLADETGGSDVLALPDQLSVPLDQCTICLDDYETGCKVRVLPCHHTFHSKCITKWLAERSATCPLCKEEFLRPTDEELQATQEQEEREWLERRRQRRRARPRRNDATVVSGSSWFGWLTPSSSSQTTTAPTEATSQDNNTTDADASDDPATVDNHATTDDPETANEEPESARGLELLQRQRRRQERRQRRAQRHEQWQQRMRTAMGRNNQPSNELAEPLLTEGENVEDVAGEEQPQEGQEQEAV